MTAPSSPPFSSSLRASWTDVYRITTLCGSMRFAVQMIAVAGELTGQDVIVLAPFVAVAPEEQTGAGGTRSHRKRRLDRLHRAKIALADDVVVVSDETGYVGESTRDEIALAEHWGLPVAYRRLSMREAARLITDLSGEG